MDSVGDGDKRDVRRPMNAFLIFCKRHRSIVREKNPDLDNRSVTRILGDLWANLKEDEKVVYTDLAKQYKDAFMKANPDYKWHNPEKTLGCQKSPLPLGKPTNAKVIKNDMNILPEGSIIPGKLADPCNMGGLSLLLMAGEQSGHVPATLPRAQEMSRLPSNNLITEVNSAHIVSEMERVPVVVSDMVPAVVSDIVPREKMKSEPVKNITGIAWNQGDAKSALGDPKDVQISNIIWEKIAQGTEPKTLATDSGLVTNLESITQPKSLLYQAVAAPKLPQRSLLAEAFREKMDFPDVLRDNSTSTKMANFENLSKIIESQMNSGTKEQKLVCKIDEKENITEKFTKDSTDDSDTKSDVEEESAMVTCGKLVVNHIIDKLYSSEFGAAFKKVNNNSDEVDGEKKDEGNLRTDVKEESEDTKESIEDNSEKEMPSETKAFVGTKTDEGSVTDRSATAKMTEESAYYIENVKTEDENSKSVKTKPHKRQLQSGSDTAECESEDVDEFQPVRKSRRRNRGQRYQELINEGIIQRSKERTAALQQTTLKEESPEEDSQPIETLNSYILPETAIRRIRKRTTSESAKDKLMFSEDAKRYKTGDFDLEAQIATLPACSVENMGRKRGFARQRHSSECFHTNRKVSELESPHQSVQVFDLHKTVSLPPHIKRVSPESNVEPVIGSRKRKARKHSITHMIPAPPTLVKNGNIKADADSLGPCLIRPPVQKFCESTDSCIKQSSISTVPLNGEGTDNQITSQKCSDWSKFDESDDLLSETNGEIDSGTNIVSDTDKCVPKPGECVDENENTETGSIHIASKDCILSSKTETRSENNLTNQSVGATATVNESFQKDGQQDEQQFKRHGSETEGEITADTEYGNENKPKDIDFVRKQSAHCVVGSASDDSMKIAKDVNSNTTMNS